MKTVIRHKIYDNSGLKFTTHWKFKTKKEARKELENCYKHLEKKDVVEIYNQDTLEYYDSINKEMNLLYIE